MTATVRAPASTRLHAHEPVQVVAAVRAPVRPASMQRAEHALLVAHEHPQLHAILREPPCRSCARSRIVLDLNPMVRSLPIALWDLIRSLPLPPWREDSPPRTYKSGFTWNVNQPSRPGAQASATPARAGRGNSACRHGRRSWRAGARRSATADREVRPAGIEPAACGLKDRCSLAPRREPLTTELRARALRIRRLGSAEHIILRTLALAARALSPCPPRRRRRGPRCPRGIAAGPSSRVR